MGEADLRGELHVVGSAHYLAQLTILMVIQSPRQLNIFGPGYSSRVCGQPKVPKLLLARL